MRIWRHCYFRSSCRFKIVLTLQYVEVLHWAEVFHAFCSIQIYGITIMAEGKYLLEKNFLFFKKLQKVVYYAVAKQNDENMLFNPSLGRQERMCVLQQSGLGTPFFSILFRALHYILFRSNKRTFRSFPFFSRVFGDL